VDASGRGALTLALLDAVDGQRSEVTEGGVDISYVSAVVEIPWIQTPPAVPAPGMQLIADFWMDFRSLITRPPGNNILGLDDAANSSRRG
jgi:hypothetical protein